MLEPGPTEMQALRRKLKRWYDRHKRDLPWRRRPTDRYHQWVAETMLQQTQVATVIPYYHRFLRQFPTVTRLARAPLDQVLALWAGLGYYARARNFHQAAQRIVHQRGGRLPETAAEWQTLPGVGRYTAGAIASITRDERVPVLDGNVKRVLARLFKVTDDIRQPQIIDAMWSVAGRLLPRRGCGDFNQAMMELGATVCTPRNPDCTACPVHRECRARSAGLVPNIPFSGPRTPPPLTHYVVAALRDGQRYLIRKRPPRSLWGGLWELPTLAMDGHRTARSALLTLLGQFWRGPAPALQIPKRPCSVLTHQLTHRTVRLRTYQLSGAELSRSRLMPGFRWAYPVDVGRYGFATAHRRIIRAVFPELNSA